MRGKLLRLYFFLLFVLSVNLLQAQDSLRLTFIGDVMQHLPQVNAAKTEDGYSYADCFKYVAKQLSHADITFANLETTLAGSPYSGYPCFSAPDELAVTLKQVGIDVLATANNHSCDKGLNGIVRTLNVLDSLEIPHLGTYRSVEERNINHPYVFTKNGFKLAVVCYTYGTNGIPVPTSTVVNLIDRFEIALDIQLAKQHRPDAIIAIMHWGNEYAHIPDRQQTELADFMLEQGVTLVVGSHPHVVQPMELAYAADGKAKGAVVYSLGNFVSNQQTKGTDGGAMAHITLVKNYGRVEVADASYSLVWVYKPIENGRKRYYILPTDEFEQQEDFFSSGYYNSFTSFTSGTHSFFDLYNKGFTKRIF